MEVLLSPTPMFRKCDCKLSRWKKLRRRETEDTTPVTDTQAYFIALLIYMQSHTMIVSLLLFLLSLVLYTYIATKTDEMYDYLYWVYQSIKSIDQFTIHGLNRIQIKYNRNARGLFPAWISPLHVMVEWRPSFEWHTHEWHDWPGLEVESVTS